MVGLVAAEDRALHEQALPVVTQRMQSDSSISDDPALEPEAGASPQETIVAISTPPGRGGIGIVRLSGPRAQAIAAPMLRLRHPWSHAQARFGDDHR